MYRRPKLPGPATSDPKVDQAQYEADCLAGRRFPVVTDAAMQARCRAEWKLREWMEIYRRYHLATKKDASNRLSKLRCHFSELLDLDPNTLTKRDVMPWFHTLGLKSHCLANDCLMELRLIFGKMEDFGWTDRPDPLARLKKFPGNKPRKRYLHYEELPLLLQSIDEEPLQFQAIFLLTLVCGCRPGEAIELLWENLKFWEETDARGTLTWRGRWIKPTSKSGESQIIPLPEEIIDRLQRLDRLSTVYVFPGDLQHCRRVADGPVSYSKVHTVWRRVCRRIKIKDLRLYDLRRSCATFMMNRGVSLGTISKGILNHSSLQHSGVYIQEMPETVEHALRDHSRFVLGGGHEQPKLAPTQPPVAPAPAVVEGESGMEWPG